MKLILLRFEIIILALTTLSAFSESTFFEKSISRPNVILIMTDDQGYGDLACHGNPWLKTPNLDKLASQGIRLDDYHVSPYCIPSRASLMTGRYADRTGIHNVNEAHWFIRSNEVLLSNMFNDAGYATGMFGKWHLGDTYPFGAEHRGFDEVLRHYGGAIGVLNDYWDNCYVDDTYYHNGKPTKVEGFCTDVFFNAAMQFIEHSVKQKKPFFVYLPTNAAHGPMICPPSYYDLYSNKTRREAGFYGMITNIDDNVGKLRAFLRNKNIDQNTIFIFTSDNGSAGGSKTYNAGMKGRKMSSYDGGHRVPFFLHWPAGGYTKERRIRTLTAHIDIAPTLLDLCGISKPETVKFDGKSLRPLLEKGDKAEWSSRILMTDAQYNGPPRKWAQTTVLNERWRLLGGGKELYDIDADPGQESNVYDKYPEVVKQLSSWYDTWWAEVEPTLKNVAQIPLGDVEVPSVELTYHDCMNRHAFWFQSEVRKITRFIDSPDRKRSPAFWPVEIVTDGEYTIELRRWPKECNAAIHADVAPGKKVYNDYAPRSAPGQGFPAHKAQLTIGEQQLVKTVNKDDVGISFRMKLLKGTTRLSAKFIDSSDRSLDAFFVYVNKLN